MSIKRTKMTHNRNKKGTNEQEPEGRIAPVEDMINRILSNPLRQLNEFEQMSKDDINFYIEHFATSIEKRMLW